MELEKLKSVYRKSFLIDLTRQENSAEHSWHLALALLIMAERIQAEFDLNKALRMALVHDICEIGAGDISVYSSARNSKQQQEREYIDSLVTDEVPFSKDIKQLWEEYEAQQTVESRCVKVLDRFLPFIINIHTEGKTWLDQNISKSQVIEINQIIKTEAPEIFDWMTTYIEDAVEKGWLRNS
ncbi:MAG: HD family hydrolase [Anaerolineales bacterium]